MSSIDIASICSEAGVNIEREAFLLTQPWAPSPLVGQNPSEIAEREKLFCDELSKSFNDNNSPLSPLGRFLVKDSLKLYQTNRKNIIEFAYQHPKVLEGDSIDSNNRLLVVAGMHRTGSTLLQNLLAEDPNARTPRTWEMVMTIPPATSESEIEHSSSAAELEKQMHKLNLLCMGWPDEMNKLHFFSARKPEEDEMLGFGVLQLWYLGYLHYFVNPELVNMLRQRGPYYFRYLHLFLKIQDAAYPPKSHWVLKNPNVSQYLPEFLEEFPEANIIVTHRNPKSVVPSWSMLNLVALHCFIYNDFTKAKNQELLSPEKWGKMWLMQSSQEIEQLVRSRELLRQLNAEKEKQILDVSFSDLVKDPEAVIRKIYDHFGYEFTPEYQQRIKQYMESNPRGKHGKAKPYSMETFKLNKEIIDEHFRDYNQQYSKFF